MVVRKALRPGRPAYVNHRRQSTMVIRKALRPAGWYDAIPLGLSVTWMTKSTRRLVTTSCKMLRPCYDLSRKKPR
jgi:hypothetical protein